MSLKKLLRLESFHMTDEEIIKKIRKAQRNHKHEVVFTSKDKTVRLRLSDVDSMGVMQGNLNQYK